MNVYEKYYPAIKLIEILSLEFIEVLKNFQFVHSVGYNL